MDCLDSNPTKVGKGLMAGGYRQLSDEEYKEKRLKGLCFSCDEKYTLEYVCQNKQFKFLLIEEEPEVGSEPEWQDAVKDLGGF